VTALAEHARIDEAMTALRGLAESIRIGPENAATDALQERFDALFEMLARHFAAEESPSYFGALATERPGTSRTIAVLCAEHSEMLELVRTLKALGADPVLARQLPETILLLIERLRTHERLETLLMQDYLLADD
jgi:iron-sulfur cluster repair protein YtfE (RIC family)